MNLSAFSRCAAFGLSVSSILMALLLTASCEDSGGGFDYGDNDPDRVVCAGDSITAGYGDNGPSYPARLSGMTGKTVVNAGSTGQAAGSGVGILRAQLRSKPGTACILFGANDAIRGGSPASVKESLRAMIQDCKANQTLPIVGTLTPMTGPHLAFSSAAMRISVEIRAVAKEEGARLVDLEKAFTNRPELLAPDGLHMSDAGNQRLAELFKGKL